MLIGEKSAFAIEWNVVSAFDGFVYGNFRFWIAGEMVGEWREEVVLGVLIHSAKVFLRFKGKRHLAEADFLKSEELWGHVDRYSNSDNLVEMSIALAGNFRTRFSVHDIADDCVAKGCTIFLIDRMDGNQRLLWKYKGSTLTREIELSKLLVDEVIEEFVRRSQE